MDDYSLVLTTVPDEQTAKAVSLGLLESRLAACVTTSPSGKSRYWWEGNITEDREFILFIKTRLDLFDSVEAKIREIHPYRVPEVIAIPIVRGSTSYLDWLSLETARRT